MNWREFFKGRPMQVVLYGLLLWAIPLAISFMAFGLKTTNPPFFETIMAVVLAVSVGIFGVMGFRGIRAHFVREGLSMGLTWMGMSIALDMGLFLEGPMKKPLGDYFTDIGLTYLIYPVIMLAMGAALQNRFEALSKEINEATIRGIVEAAKEKNAK